ncbi:MAG TPA: Sec-independent protein translocase protein TatB [Hyphomicrobium sp.]|nr:Sec-independent protein translocase protein TatB [Hyphomicrobium sp.]
MFDITSSKLLILAVVALIVVGPKDLPILLRTVGKYLGFVRRQAAEFRQHFDEALKEAELDQLKNEFDNVSREVRETVSAGSRAIDTQIEAAAAEARAKSGTATPALTGNPVAAPEGETVGAPDSIPDHSGGPDRGAA